ncbi:STAS-like domain-containing protein [Enterobacter roggenkampii]|uniref:STAS-like domain-containing protein n=1 Tax=Enterobacter roggenkampii TaxID=1812935 RepID=UPI002A840F0A|nr:STAS-like domain-containing protein [Enterobacter roggenkampii]
MIIINVKEFSKYPGPRYINLGEFSGEDFRESKLIPALLQDDDVTVNFDGVYGYGSSFLEEAFGGLVRHGIDVEKLNRLKNNLVCNDDPSIIIEVKKYIDEALSGR